MTSRLQLTLSNIAHHITNSSRQNQNSANCAAFLKYFSEIRVYKLMHTSPIDRFTPERTSVVTEQPFPLHLIAVLLIIFFGMLFNMGNPGPALLFLWCILNLGFYQKGVEVQLNSGLYRDYHRFLFFKLGKWKQLGAYDFLLITAKPVRKQAMVTVAYSVPYGDLVYDLDLITNGKRDVLLLRTGDREALLEFGIKTGSHFHLPVRERISGEYYAIYQPPSPKAN